MSSALLSAATTAAVGLIPAPLLQIGQLAENIYTAAKTGDWATAALKLTALQDAATQYKASLKSPTPAQKTATGNLDTMLAGLAKSVPAKDQLATLQQANQITNVAANLSSSYNPLVPAQVGQLGSLARDLQIYSTASGDLAKLKSTATQLGTTWAALQPLLLAKGGATQAGAFSKLITQVASAKSVADFAALAQPILDQIGSLAAVFGKK